MSNDLQIMNILKTVIDPELNMNIVDLGMVYEVNLEGENASVIMTLTSPGCPLGPMIEGQVQDAIKSNFPDINNVDVQIVFDPPWNPAMMSEEAKLELGFNI